jgi:Ser/Thr protein kinase RdoA (MazF antagonist)
LIAEHPYERLTPDLILDALEAVGFVPSGSLLALNSYENRVYQIGLDDGSFAVAKFYRPERWSDAAIAEEHAFALELAAHDVPVVAPLAIDGRTLHHHGGFRFAVFPRRGGRWPELEDPEVRLRLGRFIGRLHMVGSAGRFANRPLIDIAYGRDGVAAVRESGLLPPEHARQYVELADQLLASAETALGRVGDIAQIRLHGDFHPGNVLWTEGGAHLVDLDDCRTGPAIQDLWMLLSGDKGQMQTQLGDLLAGYEEFHDFDWREVRLIEPLRTLRLIHYAGWLARRWADPAFPRAFPWFGTPRYWDEQVLTLREQVNRMAMAEEDPLSG